MLVNKMLKPVRLQLYSGLELEQKEDVLRESVIVQQHAITRMKKEYELKDQLVYLKGYCTGFQHALKSLEITGIVLSIRMSKTARKKFQRIKKL